MSAAVDWSNLTVAAAFVVGAVAGSIGAIRVMRHVLEYMRRDDKPPRGP